MNLLLSYWGGILLTNVTMTQSAANLKMDEKLLELYFSSFGVTHMARMRGLSLTLPSLDHQQTQNNWALGSE